VAKKADEARMIVSELIHKATGMKDPSIDSDLGGDWSLGGRGTCSFETRVTTPAAVGPIWASRHSPQAPRKETICIATPLHDVFHRSVLLACSLVWDRRGDAPPNMCDRYKGHGESDARHSLHYYPGCLASDEGKPYWLAYADTAPNYVDTKMDLGSRQTGTDIPERNVMVEVFRSAKSV